MSRVVDLCGIVIVQNELSFKSEYTKPCDLSHCNMNGEKRLEAFFAGISVSALYSIIVTIL